VFKKKKYKILSTFSRPSLLVQDRRKIFVVVIPHHTDVTMGEIAANTLHKKNLCLNKILRVLFKEKYED